MAQLLTQQFAFDYLHKCAAIIIDSSSSEVNLASSEDWYKLAEVARLGTDAKVSEFRPAFEGHTSSAQASQGRGRTIPPENLDSHIAVLRALAGLREHPFTPRLKQITCPALIVGGGQDGTAGAGGSIVLSRNLPNARLQVFQDAGHGIYKQKQNEFRTLVLEFCRDQGII